MTTKGAQRTYDHRLVRLVQYTGEATIETWLGAARSAAMDWDPPGVHPRSSETRGDGAEKEGLEF
jgi:hypothetical protein